MKASALWRVIFHFKEEVIFFEKNNQKTFGARELWHWRCQNTQEPKVFLLLFLQKKKVFLASLSSRNIHIRKYQRLCAMISL